jgi:predicted aspartyl protease
MPLLTSRGNNLRFTGPIVEVVIVPPQPVAEQLRKEGKVVPTIKATALIDTGASSTCINQNIVDALKLIAFDTQKVLTAGGPSEQLLYDVGVVLPISQPNIISVQAPCADLSGQPFQVLLGRDVLSMCTMFYNGPDNSFSLHF